MKRLAAALSLLALSGALVFPSAAAPFALSQSDAITDDVTLAPTTGPNGDYAYLDGNDELVVDLTASNPNLAGDAEGVNPDGVTTFADVFRVRYNGSRYAHVWITDDSDAVTFVVAGEPIQSETSNVTLGPNESVAVGVVVDTTGGSADGLLDGIEVHARVADPEATVAAASRSGGGGGGRDATSIRVDAPGSAERGVRVDDPRDDPVTVRLDAMALDDGGDVTLDEIDLTAAGGDRLAVDLAAVPPDPDAGPGSVVGVEGLAAVEVSEADTGSVDAATLRFSVSPAFLDARGVEPGELIAFRTSDGETSERPVRVVGPRADGRVVFEVDTPGFSTFTVAAPRPAIGVTDASLSTASVETGGTATVTARVRNGGRAPGVRTVTLTLDGEVVAERAVDLGPNETMTATFEVAPAAAGSYAVAVDGTPAGTLSVGGTESTPDAPGTEPPSERADTDGDAPTAAAGTPADEESDLATAATSATAAPVEEPAGLGVTAVAGLAAAVALLAATLLLVRRRSQ